MPRGTTKRRPITVTALLDGAMELFAEQGYGATSIPDICDRAGLTKGAFYSNFANKDALFLALLDRSWDQRADVDPPGHAGRRRPGRSVRTADTRVPIARSTDSGRSSPRNSPCTPFDSRTWPSSS